MKFTEQQEDIFKSEEKVILIKAFAGSGKTTTLIEFAKRKPKSKMLYLAFNNSVVENAKGKFPSNVNIMTTHTLAYREFGISISHKLKNNIKVLDVIELLSLNKRYREDITFAKALIEYINLYTSSDYKNIFEVIPPKTNFSREKIRDALEIIWDSMLDNTSDFPCTHDTYLKLYQLSQPQLNFDYILYDEAQDANPVIVDIISRQARMLGTRLVIVGDSHQAIYSFRNAVDALVKFNHKKEYYLSKSFRFGNNIAFSVNAILQVLKGEKVLIEGAEHEDNVVSKISTDKKITIISRTNSSLFLKAIEAIDKNKKIHFISGIDKYNFSKVKDVDYLYQGKISRIRDQSIKDFENYSNFLSVAEHTQDSELIFLKKIVNKYHGKIEDLMDRIHANLVSEKAADVILTTAHKSKGLEFENVFLCNDFARFFDSEGRAIARNWKEDEINILYVAASRATHCLQYNSMLNNVTKVYKNSFVKEKSEVKEKNTLSKIESKLKNKIIHND